MYRRDGDQITVTMSVDDYERFVMMLGGVLGVIGTDQRDIFYGWLAMVNRLMEGNPQFTPYEIPKEYE